VKGWVKVLLAVGFVVFLANSVRRTYDNPYFSNTDIASIGCSDVLERVEGMRVTDGSSSRTIDDVISLTEANRVGESFICMGSAKMSNNRLNGIAVRVYKTESDVEFEVKAIGFGS
jgi:hypothetical protein